MALIRSLTVNGVTHPEAYSKIETIRCDKNNAYIFVCSYADESARASGDFPVFAEEHMTDLSVVNGDTFPLAYGHIKGLPGYEGATDHLVVIPLMEETPAEGGDPMPPAPMPPLDPNFDA
jgi:hypothetical protein